MNKPTVAADVNDMFVDVDLLNLEFRGRYIEVSVRRLTTGSKGTSSSVLSTRSDTITTQSAYSSESSATAGTSEAYTLAATSSRARITNMTPAATARRVPPPAPPTRVGHEIHTIDLLDSIYFVSRNQRRRSARA